MAYALGLPVSVTDLVHLYRDWRFEEVTRSNGTPTALAIKDLLTHDANELQVHKAISEGEEVDYERPNGYANSFFVLLFHLILARMITLLRAARSRRWPSCSYRILVVMI